LQALAILVVNYGAHRDLRGAARPFWIL
jgi:hypothetical protein